MTSAPETGRWVGNSRRRVRARLPKATLAATISPQVWDATGPQTECSMQGVEDALASNLNISTATNQMGCRSEKEKKDRGSGDFRGEGSALDTLRSHPLRKCSHTLTGGSRSKKKIGTLAGQQRQGRAPGQHRLEYWAAKAHETEKMCEDPWSSEKMGKWCVVIGGSDQDCGGPSAIGGDRIAKVQYPQRRTKRTRWAGPAGVMSATITYASRAEKKSERRALNVGVETRPERLSQNHGTGARTRGSALNWEGTNKGNIRRHPTAKRKTPNRPFRRKAQRNACAFRD